jgi:RNA polymerase sigma factor (sigma-70 family)
MTDLSTDARLVTEFLAGDTSALAAIYDRYAAGLYDTAAAMLSDRNDAADMVQDVFCIAAERLSQLRQPDRLKPWLYAVLRHEVYRRTKKRRRSTPVDFQDEATPDVASGYDPHAPGEAVAYEELAALVRSAASGLDERDRLVLELSVRQGLAGADLADALGVTPDQSYSLVHRMRERVEKSLGALTVAQAGRRDCEQLDRILVGWDGELTILLRKRVNRHIEECSTCDRTRRKFAPLALFGAAPIFAVPSGLREKVLAAALSGNGPGNGPGNEPGNEPGNIRFDAQQGFPTAARVGRHAVWWATSAVVIAVVGAGVLVAASGTDDSATPRAATEIVATGAGSVDDSSNPSDSSLDRQIVSGGGGVITIFDDESDELPAVEDSTPDVIGGAGGPAPSSTTAAPIPPSSAPVVPLVPETTDTPSTAVPTPAPSTAAPTTATTTAPTTTTTTRAPIVLQGVQMSTSAFDFGSTTTGIKVVLRNPNSFPVSYDSSFSSAEFSASPRTGTLAAGEQISFAVNFDRAGAVADTTNFATGTFSHTLTLTTSTTGTSSTVVRMTTLLGTIVRSSTTSPPIAVSVSKVAGSALQCSTLGIRAVVTTNGQVAAGAVLGEARFENVDGKLLGTVTSLTMTLGSDGYWRTTTPLPSGTTKVLIRVTATTTTGQFDTGTATLTTAC